MQNQTQSGTIAIIGRPNVGKSTLLNRFLGEKLSITSRKPQTTRQQILGIKTVGSIQAIYMDTPGLHLDAKTAMNRYMNRAAASLLMDVNVIIWLIEAMQWTAEEDDIIKRVATTNIPIILVINKVDKFKDKETLLPFIKKVQDKRDYVAIVPISAEKGINIENLEAEIEQYLPEGPHYYADNQLTDRNDRFLTAEIIREKLMRTLGDELPYATSVQIELFQEEETINRISAIIWVERQGQRQIVIGKGGRKLKTIGTRAREDLEKQFSKKVFLQLWVKIRKDWSNDESALQEFGYD